MPALKAKLGGFNHSTSAKVTLASLVFWVSATLDANDIQKHFAGHLGGAGSPGGES